jgi:proteasome lid subunit RPN8/RPN11/LysM repeat protein
MAASKTFLEPTEFFQVGQEEPGLRVYLRYDLFRVLDEFSNRDPRKEQAALLVGQFHEADEGDFLVVEDAIEVPVGDEQSGGRLGSRSWQQARKVAQTRHQDRSIVGWFHTHAGKLDPSAEEREVHARYFPEPWQMLYLIDPVGKDRNFFRPLEGRLGAVRGFRIFGKESALEVPIEKEKIARPAPPASKTEEQLRERYIERSLEKIQRALRRPPTRPIDVVIVLLLFCNLAVLLLRPVPVAKVDTSSMKESQRKLTEQVKTVGSRLEKLEQHLAAMRVIDEQLASASPTATPSASASPKPTASATPTPNPRTAPEPGSDEVKSYQVTRGDTLSIIAERFYGTSARHILKGLSHFNRLKGMEIFPGDTLKIPAKDKLH